jgi:hypothetical protein
MVIRRHNQENDKITRNVPHAVDKDLHDAGTMNHSLVYTTIESALLI